MDSEEAKLFAAALRQLTQAHSGVALDAALDELGWADAMADDSRTAVATLFESQGEYDVTSTALDAVIAIAVGLPLGRIVLPALARHDAPGVADGDRIRVHGLCRGAVSGGVRVVTATSDGYRALSVAPGDYQVKTVAGMAPALKLVEITAEVAMSDASEPVDWPSGVAAGQRALAHELVGTSRAMLRLAREHAIERVQFGRPIASFQAVRHRLAEALVAVEAAHAAADAAWCDDSASTNAALAKAVAGRSARIVARHAQQVLAGIGFTTEHPLHRHVRRALVLDGLFGSGRTLTREIGAEVLRSRQVPRPLPL